MQKKWGIFIIAVFGLAMLAKTTAAQISSQPQFLMTWSASDSYVPPGYAGKILPGQSSGITASFEVIINGKPVDLSGQTIYWYLNDNLIGGGVGAQRAAFHPNVSAPGTIQLKVEVPDYPSGILAHQISIPIVQPEAIVEAPYPSGEFATTQPNVVALPYFFAVTSTMPLSFAWSVNGQTVSDAENPQTLQISLPQSTPNGFALAVSLAIQNPNDSTAAAATANLTYQRQL